MPLLLPSSLLLLAASPAHGPAAWAALGPQDLPPRLQWPDAGGYCGETAIQTVALAHGTWVSQAVVRRLAGGEVLLGKNETRALRSLGLAYETWRPGKGPGLPAFLDWLRGHLGRGTPCLLAVYLAGGTHGAYDHIIPVVGLVPQDPRARTMGPLDRLILHSLVSPRAVQRVAGGLGSRRETCRAGLLEGGNIPEDRPFGVAIPGPLRPPRLPVRLSVDRPDEPNPHRGEAPCGLRGTLRVTGLKAGTAYRLLRSDGLPGHSRITHQDFRAEGETWTWEDPTPIPSDGLTTYRCLSR